MSLAGIHSSFTFDGRAFDSEVDLLGFMEQNYPKGFDLLRSWFDNREIPVKTSGSTGTPKTLHFTRGQMTASAEATGRYFKMGPGSRALLCLPLDYIAGKMMLVRAMVLGWSLEGVEPKIRLDLDKRGTYDFAAMIPMQLESNLDCLGRINNLIVGGAPVHWSLQERLENRSTRIFATYGMTETITHVAVRPLNESARSLSDGAAASTKTDSTEQFTGLPGVSFFQDERGCLVIRCPRISNGDIVTNDLVELTSENSFIWQGRIDNLINSAGLKLVPEAIERKFSKSISNRFFAAGVPDDKLGERMIFVIEGQADGTMMARIRSFQADSDGKIQKNELPKELIFLPEFAETDSGKINRNRTLELIKKTLN